MNQCLRCSKPCEATSVFCDGCRSLLRSQLWQDASTRSEVAIEVAPAVVMSPEREEADVGVSGDPLERITCPHPMVSVPLPQTPLAPQTPMPLSLPGSYSNVEEHAIHRLSEAAQRIAQVEQGNRRVPRASRLAPMRDISADIQRESTPLAKIGKAPESGRGKSRLDQDLEQHIPDLWPWLQDTDQDESESDSWSNRTDPLLARHFPNSAEIARIEEEDMRRAIAEGVVTVALPRRAKPSQRVRLIFFVVAVALLLAFMVDSVLIVFAFMHTHHTPPVQNGPPTLTLSSNAANVGQTIILHIRHFSAATHVYVTHDIREAVQLTSGTALISIGPTGSADATMLVDTTWGPGFHTIEAEDVTTRYTASATLQITGAGPTRPSHLLIGATSLDMGADVQGANTLQRLTLHNSGGGSISWAASSNQPWLLTSPTEGVFSTSQTITAAVERANLKAGDYKGTITFSSNVGGAERVQVVMTVRPLPANVGAVLQVTPAVLSFTALDGGTNPAAQVLMVGNPGLQRLNWSLSSNTPVQLTDQSVFASQTGWLSTDQTSGVVVPHATGYIQVFVNSQNLLPGVYTDMLVFSGSQGVYNSPQNVSVSLTVQPRCGMALSTGSMSFTAVTGQSNQGIQSLSLSATVSCASGINWNAISAASWLTVTPASGQLRGAASTVTSVGVNATGLKPGSYVSTISFLTGQSTATLMVQLIVQAPLPPSAPIMGAAPLSLNFSMTQGMANPPGQVVTITNTGGGTLQWRTSVNTLATSWLGAGPTGGTIAPGQTGQVTVNVNTAGLTPNTYLGQVILNGTDTHGVTAGGNPQTITVNLLVLPPCTMEQPSSRSLAFSATQGSPGPSIQSVVIMASGNCGWPLSWNAATNGSPPSWLNLTPSSGLIAVSGQSATLSVSVNIAGLLPGTYATQVAISATDGSSTAVQGSLQYVSVTLTVFQPCSLQVSNTRLVFNATQNQPAPSAQSFTLSETGNCARPVSWMVAGDAKSSAWLGLSPTSGTDNGTGGSVNVSIITTNMSPGTYTGFIAVSASGSGGAVVQGSPAISVTLTVLGFNVSGSVVACADSTCSSSKLLPGAILTVTDSGGITVGTISADGAGNYVLNNLASGNYTISISGSDGTKSYSGNVVVDVTSNRSNFPLNVYPLL